MLAAAVVDRHAHGSRQHVLLDPPPGRVVLGRAHLAQCGRRRRSEGRRAGSGASSGSTGRRSRDGVDDAAEDAHRPRERRRPQDRPVAAEHGQADPVVDGEPVAARAQRDPDQLGRPAVRRHRRRVGIGPPVGQVQGAGRDEARRAVRGHVGQADDARRDRHRRPQPEVDLGHAEDGDRLAKRLGRVGQAAGLVGAEVAGEAVRGPAGSPREATGRAHGRPVTRACPIRPVTAAGGPGRHPSHRCAGRARPERIFVEHQLERLRARHREGVGRTPSAGPGRRERLGPRPLALEPGQRRLPLPAVVDARR